jgi:hypothetical protein
VGRVTLEPEGEELAFEQKEGTIEVRISSFICHAMVVLHDQ